MTLLLFGPVTRDHASGTGDDARILLIVRDASPGALRPAEPLIAEWAHRGKSPPLIFSDTEWRASTDVFPIEIEDMREAHRLLAGSDPFEDLETTRDDLRRELEREIRGKLLHLRTDYAAMATNGSALSKLLLDSADTFFVIFRAVIRLAGRTPPRSPAEQVRIVAELAGVEVDVFDWVVAAVSGEKVRGLRPYDEAAARYVEAVEQLAHYVDTA